MAKVYSIFEELEEEMDIKLKEQQKNILKHAVSQEDSFIILPTGFGKSMCFALHHKVMDKVSRPI